jgi:predicted DNA-binding transcriptional regulator YafY
MIGLLQAGRGYNAEALAMLVLCHELGDGVGLPFLGPARSAAVKLESGLPARLREQLRNVSAAMHIQPSPRNPLVAQNVAEVNWHKTQRTVPRDDGALDFHVTVSGLNEISWWILGYGDQAEVLQPPELRQLVAGRAKRMAEMYR